METPTKEKYGLGPKKDSGKDTPNKENCKLVPNRVIWSPLVEPNKNHHGGMHTLNFDDPVQMSGNVLVNSFLGISSPFYILSKRLLKRPS